MDFFHDCRDYHDLFVSSRHYDYVVYLAACQVLSAFVGMHFWVKSCQAGGGFVRAAPALEMSDPSCQI